MPQPTIVLVHGAWADASSWNAVASELQGQGFTVLAPPNLLRGVAPDAAYIASFLAQRTSGPVVLAGHSYGGFVITNAATGGGDVRALVYVDAFIPDEGETTFGILGGSGSALDVPDPDHRPRHRRLPGRARGRRRGVPEARHACTPSFAQDLPEADRWLIAATPAADHARRQHHPLRRRRHGSRCRAGRSSAPEDRVIPPDTQRNMAERAGATITEVAASHVSMVSHPQVTIDAILAAVAAVGD